MDLDTLYFFRDEIEKQAFTPAISGKMMSSSNPIVKKLGHLYAKYAPGAQGAGEALLSASQYGLPGMVGLGKRTAFRAAAKRAPILKNKPGTGELLRFTAALA
jgi:hypothetical protein